MGFSFNYIVDMYIVYQSCELSHTRIMLRVVVVVVFSCHEVCGV